MDSEYEHRVWSSSSWSAQSEGVQRLVAGYRSGGVPRKEYCRLHGIGLRPLDRYLHEWQKRQSGGGREVPAEGRLVAVEIDSAETLSKPHRQPQ
jgi:hypothetical protein